MSGKKQKVQLGAKIGFISRIEYGSEGFRQSLIDAGFQKFKEEGTHFNVLVGGLVNKTVITKQLKEWVKKKLADIPARERTAEIRKELEEKFCLRIAKDLARIIPNTTVPDPENPSKEKPVDLFVMTSPAFDGDIGETIAGALSEIRSDIRLWHKGGDRIFVKYVDKIIWALAPEKAAWMRNDYYSTAVERVIKDKIKQTSQSSPNLYVIGCFGSSINKPMGELKYRYISLPVLHRIEETRVAENQIGVRVLEYAPAEATEQEHYLVRTHTLKDLIARELLSIAPPPDATPAQKKIIEIMKARNWVTPGMLRYMIDLPSETIEKEMKSLLRKKSVQKKGESFPGVIFVEASKKYYFNLPWIQRKLRYSAPQGAMHEDRIVSFACLHGGSIETDYEFFVNEVPRIILERNATILVGAGDITEGTKHNLGERGELIAGMNNTDIQQIYSAHLANTVMMRAFEKNFEKSLAAFKEKPDAKTIDALIRANLVEFDYIPGNHDLWDAAEGHLPLKIFHDTLIKLLAQSVTNILIKYGLPLVPLNNLINAKVRKADFFELPSGLKVCVQHPHMSRTKTTSIRPQEMLDYAKRHGCQVSIGGNFHTSEHIEEWDMDLGQCVSQMIGTVKHGSNFERNKMKIVDQGVGYMRIVSHNGRILMSESAFYGEPRPKPPVDNLAIINSFIEKLGIDPIKI